MYINKRNLVIFFVLFLIIFLPIKVLAVDLSLPKTVINPNSYLLYSVKRLFEKTIIFIKFTKESKADYYQKLILTRMSELKIVVDKNLLSEVQQSSQRLSYQIGILSDYISINKEELQKKQKETVDILNSLKNPLATLRDKYPANSAYWLLIQHDINSIDLNLEKLK